MAFDGIDFEDSNIPSELPSQMIGFQRFPLEAFGQQKAAELIVDAAVLTFLDALRQTNGADYRSRTDDLPLTRRLLYQLS